MEDHPEKDTARTDVTGQRHFARNLMFSWGGYLVNLVAGFILPRIMDERLGQFQLGLWDFAWSMIGYLCLMEMGLGQSVVRFFARDRASGDNTALTKCVSSMALCMYALGLLILLGSGAVSVFVLPWFAEDLGAALPEMQWVIVLLAVGTAADAFFSVYWSALVASHRWDSHNIISASVSLVSTAGMIAAILLGHGLAVMAAIQSVCMVAGHLWRRKLAFRLCPDLKVVWRMAEFGVVLDQVRFAAKNLIPRVADMLMNQTVSVMLTAFAGPAALAVFSRPRALTKHLRALVGKFSSILMPSASAMQAREDHAGLREMFLKRSEQAGSFSVPALLWMAVLGGPFISVWMGADYFHAGLVPVICAGFLATLIQDPVWAIMAGLNRHGSIALVKLGGAVVCVGTVAAGLYLGEDKLLWAAAGISLPLLVVDGILVPLLACRAMQVAPSEFYRRTLLKPVLCFLPAGLCIIPARLLLGDNMLLMLGVAAVTGGPLQAITFWKFVLPSGAKEKLSRRFRRRSDPAPAVPVAPAPDAPAGPHIIVIFRNDDPSALSDLEHERRIFGIFEKYGVPQTLGIVPRMSLSNVHTRESGGEKPLLDNPAVTAFLRDYVQRSGSEIALHGLTHRTNRFSNPARRDYSEFQRLPLPEQQEMIETGAAILEQAFGTRPVTFIPPWNRLDENTVQACQEAGFRTISAGAYTAVPEGMLSCGANSDTVNFTAALTAAKESSRTVLITVLFHSNTKQAPEDIARLEAILETVSSDPACRCLTVAEAARQYPELLGVRNEAGRNEVRFATLKNSVRAKVWFYLQLIPLLSRISGLEKLQQGAVRLYQRGNYAEARAAGLLIDDKCRSILFSTRAAFLFLGTAGGALLAGLRIPEAVLPGLLSGVVPAVIIAAGLLFSRRASAAATRRETVTAACLLALGTCASLWTGQFALAH